MILIPWNMAWAASPKIHALPSDQVGIGSSALSCQRLTIEGARPRNCCHLSSRWLSDTSIASLEMSVRHSWIKLSEGDRRNRATIHWLDIDWSRLSLHTTVTLRISPRSGHLIAYTKICPLWSFGKNAIGPASPSSIIHSVPGKFPRRRFSRMKRKAHIPVAGGAGRLELIAWRIRDCQQKSHERSVHWGTQSF